LVLTKMVINAVASKLTKHFRLDKIMSYVFDDNELDKKTRELESRVELLETMLKMSKNFICECGKEK
tara:strand:+ start:189 stop:389 length:201 start_codon:yes stop_codon:yes gene_type:complete